MAVAQPVPDAGTGSQAGSQTPLASFPDQAALRVAQAAYKAGFRGSSLTTVTAIGLAESGGSPTSHNPNAATGDDSYGVWQINYYGDLRNGRTAEFGPPNGLYNIDANAAAAYKLSGGGKSFRDWTTYTKGVYTTFMPRAQAATNALLGGASPGAIGNAPGTFADQTAAGTATTTQTGDTPLVDHCIVSLPSLGPIGGGCLLSTNQARGILGAMLLAGGIVIAGVGIILLVGEHVPITTPIGKIGGAARNTIAPDPGDVAYDRYQQERTEGTNRHRLGVVRDADGNTF